MYCASVDRQNGGVRKDCHASGGMVGARFHVSRDGGAIERYATNLQPQQLDVMLARVLPSMRDAFEGVPLKPITYTTTLTTHSPQYKQW